MNGRGYDAVIAFMASCKDRPSTWTKKSIVLPAESRSGQRQYGSLTTRPGEAHNRKLRPPF